LAVAQAHEVHMKLFWTYEDTPREPSVRAVLRMRIKVNFHLVFSDVFALQRSISLLSILFKLLQVEFMKLCWQPTRAFVSA